MQQADRIDPWRSAGNESEDRPRASISTIAHVKLTLHDLEKAKKVSVIDEGVGDSMIQHEINS